MLDETAEFGQRATRRLHEAIIGWLTTVSPDGAPQPIPVWFLWNGDRSMLLYSRPGRRKLRNIEANPNVSLNLDSDGYDTDIVICWGDARVSDDPPATAVPEYIEKYAGPIELQGWTPESFAKDFSVPFRIELTRIYGH